MRIMPIRVSTLPGPHFKSLMMLSRAFQQEPMNRPTAIKDNVTETIAVRTVVTCKPLVDLAVEAALSTAVIAEKIMAATVRPKAPAPAFSQDLQIEPEQLEYSVVTVVWERVTQRRPQ
jgi:hypothetical protein